MLVVPGQRVGPYRLGMLLNEAISSIQRAKRKFALQFDDESPLATDICVQLPEEGLNLRFEPRSQRLLLIDVCDLSKMRLSVSKDGGQAVFSDGSNLTPTFLLVYELLGPTYPGSFDATHAAYFLSYSGICFLFPIPEAFQHLYSASVQRDPADPADHGINDVPLELPDGTTPAVTRLFVYNGPSVHQPFLPSPLLNGVSAASPTAGPDSMLVPAPVQVQLWGTMTINFPSLGCSIGTCSSAQDILHRLGSPPSVFFKGAGLRGSQHSHHPTHQAQSIGGANKPKDYFYNYSHLGMDLLFDARSHLLKKAVLHTNFIGHPAFHSYDKCHFKLLLPLRGLGGEQHGAAAGGAESASAFDNAGGDARSEGNGNGNGSGMIELTSDCTWAEIEARLQMQEDEQRQQQQVFAGTGPPPLPAQQAKARPRAKARPMVHGSSTAAHPFGSTLLYAPFPGCVFEVMRKSGHIASVTLFQPEGRCAQWETQQQQYL